MAEIEGGGKSAWSGINQIRQFSESPLVGAKKGPKTGSPRGLRFGARPEIEGGVKARRGVKARGIQVIRSGFRGLVVAATPAAVTAAAEWLQEV